MAATDVLTKIATGITAVGKENGQFRQLAAQQNSSVSKFIKDISKMFTSQAGLSSQINNSLNNLEQTTTTNSQKIDQTNALLGQSISLQTNMLNQLKELVKSFETAFSGEGGLGDTLKKIGVGLAAGGAMGTMGSDLFGNNNGGFDSGNLPAGAGTSNSAEEALKFFESKGWSKPQAAGIVGNLQAESGKNLNTESVGDGGKAYGIAQWHPDRQANFQKKFGKPIQGSSFQEQLEFVQWELENTESKAGNMLKGAQSAAEAAAIIDQHYERSSGEHRKQRMGNAEALVPKESGTEQDDASAPQGTIVQKDAPTNNYGGGGAVHEKQAQLAGIRKLPLSGKLKNVLNQAAAAAGVEAIVYSGGQAPKGSGGPRTGSTRHDHGNAADLYLMKGGRKLSDTNPQDKAIMAKFVSAAVQAGATGVGAGHGYMGPSNIHVGFGKQATWGGADWIKTAASGIFSNKDLSGGGEGSGSGNYGEGSSNFSNFGGGGSVGGGGMVGGGPIGNSMGMGMGGGMFGGMMPGFPMLGGLGGLIGLGSQIFGSLMSGISSGGGQDNDNEELTEEKVAEAPSAPDNKKNSTVEGDDLISYQKLSGKSNQPSFVQSEPKSIGRMQAAAVESDALRFNQPQIEQPQQMANTPDRSQGISKNEDAHRMGNPSLSSFSSSPSWYMQLAGRIHYDDALKFKGGVLA